VNIYQALKRVFVGRRLASAQLGETLLPKRLALPVFASDALSSVAYAPDEILITLSLAGMTGYLFSWQIGLAVGVVIAVVAMSYRQTVRAARAGMWSNPGCESLFHPYVGVMFMPAGGCDHVRHRGGRQPRCRRIRQTFQNMGYSKP